MILLILLLSLFSLSPPVKYVLPVNHLPSKESTLPIDIKDVNLLKINLNSLSAKSIFVKEIRGEILLAKNAQQEKDIASLTKLMSAYLGFLLFKSDEMFVFNKEAISQEGEVGRFAVGEKISRDDLLKASLIASSNDSIYLLAAKYNLKNFVELMNETAKKIGMNKTWFSNPTGLETNGYNTSTAYNLSLLLEKIYSQTPTILNWTTLEKIVINKKNLWTTNLILPKYKSIIVGGKTGFTPYAGECLVLLLKFNNSPFISLVILDSQNRWQDAENIIKSLQTYYGE